MDCIRLFIVRTLVYNLKFKHKLIDEQASGGVEVKEDGFQRRRRPPPLPQPTVINLCLDIRNR